MDPPATVRWVAVCDEHGDYYALDWRDRRVRCPRCTREAERRRQARAASIRRPPRPPHTNEPGCSLCGTFPLPPRRRSWCSDDCTSLWNIASSSRAALAHLSALHGHTCWGCGATWEPGRVEPWDLLGYVREHMPGGPSCPWPPPEHGPPSPRRVALYVDHVRPLWSLTDEERTDLRWWLPFNLQLLCRPCHRDKTTREAAQRAEVKRLARWDA